MRARSDKVDEMLRRCRIRCVAVHGNEFHLRGLKCRKGQHNPIRIKAQISHLKGTCMRQNTCIRKQLTHGLLYTQGLINRHLTRCRDRDQQGLDMWDAIQFFLCLFRFALGISGTGNDICQLLHMPS